MNKVIVGSVIRHILTVVATLLAAKGISIDAGTVTSITDLIVGLMLGGGVMVQSYVEKSKPKDVLIENPIIEPEPVVLHKGFFLSDRSLKAMKGLHKDLVQLIKVGIVNSPYDFVITEGLRSAERQAEMLRTKKSKVRHSKHQDGFAVDIMAYDENGKGTWEHTYYEAINSHIQEVANLEGIVITWGGTWTTLVDAVHFQIEI